jgi:hypothetical protein
MHPNDPIHPFGTIESAQEFMELLEDSSREALSDVERDLAAATEAGEDRRIEALSLAVYKINKLADHVHKSGRILNDLRSLRRLLYGERQRQATNSGE